MSEERKNSKPTVREHRERIDMCRNLLGKGYRDGDIKTVVSKRYGTSRRTVERYLRRAREIMREELGRDKETLQSEAFEVYRAILTSDESKPLDRIRARERMDKLLGLDAPTKVAPTSPDGSMPFRVAAENMTTEALEALAQLHGNHTGE